MTSLETLQSAISNVSVWRQGDVCAPHKPLLLLYVLSQYKAGHPRLFNYGLEIHEPLTRLLKSLAPSDALTIPICLSGDSELTASGKLLMRKAANPVEATPSRQRKS